MGERFTDPRRLIDDPTFRHYVRQTDPDAVQHWTAWLDRHPDQLPLVREATRLVQQLDQLPRYALTDAQIAAEVARLQTRIDTGEPLSLEPGAKPASHPRRIGWRIAWAAAASVMMLVGIWFYARLAAPTLALRQATRPAPSETAPAPVADKPLSVAQTPYGKRESVSLPDGSVVTLNAHSTLEVIRWTNTQREVRLRGEAFFRVSKKTVAGQPIKFVVRAGNVAVEVLGTQFDVSTRNRRVKIALSEGHIRLKILDVAQPNAEPVRSLDMLPGDLVDLADEQNLTLSSRVETADYSAWVSNELVFDETPLADVARLIEENYGCTVQFADSGLASRRLTARLPDPNLDILLKAIAKAFSLSITQTNKTIRIAAAQ